jgi:hypothetical protein
MTYAIPQGIQVSLTGQDGSWYKLTDHNRQPISISYTLIESTDRMANGTLRKFVVARKFVISANWRDLPTLDSNLVDYNTKDGDHAHGGAWIKAFYEGNYGNPVYVKLVFAHEGAVADGLPNGIYTDSQHSSSGTNQVYEAFMSTFTYDVTKRRIGPIVNGVQTGYDYVDIKIEFTEI